MKKCARLMSFLLVAVMLFAMIPFNVSAASPLDGKKILFFGDSLTEKGGSSRYTSLLQSSFPNSTIINSGVSGNSTYNARLRFDTDVLAKNPDIVFICLGMNDAAIDNASTGATVKPIATYRRNIRNFITALHNIGCDVVLMTPNPVCAATDPGRTQPNYVKGKHVEFCDVLRELAVENNCGLVDMYTVFEANSYVNSTYIYDGLHQTAAGHKVFANHIAAYLNAVYNNTNKATLTVNYVTEGGKQIGKQDYIGASGANIKLLVPQIEGYQAISQNIKTTLSNTSIQFTYKSPWEDTLAKLNAIDKSEYAEKVLSEIDFYRQLGENSTNAADIAFASGKLEYLLTVKGNTELVYSTGLAYTTNPASNYMYTGNDNRFIDDNVRLSDGSKSNTDGYNDNGSYYSVWQGTNFEIVFDFYHEIAVDTFRGYFADGQMGISCPDKISVSVSKNGTDYTKINATAKKEKLASQGDWSRYCYSITTDAVNARYVKFTVNPVTWGSKCAWIDEVEVALSDPNLTVNETQPPEEDTSSDVTEESSDVIDDSSDVVDDSSDVVDDSSDVVDDSSDVIDESSDVVDESSDVNDESSDVVDDSTDDSSEDTSSDVSDGDTSEDEEDVETGDINENGKIDMTDYILLKRAYFGTYTFNDRQNKAGDINDNGKIDMTDYILLKRIYFGTYTLKK